MDPSAQRVLDQAQELQNAFELLRSSLNQEIFTSSNTTLHLSIRGQDTIESLQLYNPHDPDIAQNLQTALQDCLNQYEKAYIAALEVLDKQFEERLPDDTR